MPFISVRDIQIYYEISGKGPRLLYISGTGADLRNKPNIFDSPLADQFEILAFDQRGLGQSERPDIRYSMEDYADDAAELLNALDWERCHVLGISFGGMVAQELALRHADCIDRMVLCCTSSGGAGGHSYPFHEMPELPEDEMESLSVAINDNRHHSEWQKQNPEQYRTILALNNARNAGADEPGRETGARRQLEARIDHDTHERASVDWQRRRLRQRGRSLRSRESNGDRRQAGARLGHRRGGGAGGHGRRRRGGPGRVRGDGPAVCR